LLLFIIQILHSVEEYIGRLYELFPPAQLVSGLISQSLERGFVIFNVALVSFGFWRFLVANAAPMVGGCPLCVDLGMA
jgi:hypothetical protein